MNKIDTERIKSITNQMIGYENFKKEKIMIKNKIKKVTYVFLGTITLSMGTLTVDALTNNAISDTIKNIFSIKMHIDGQEQNASCFKKENGIITCTTNNQITESKENTTFDIKLTDK